MKQRLVEEFHRLFRRLPEVVASAPGCLTLMGHGGGKVVAVATHLRTWVALARRPDRRVFLRTLSAGGESALSLDRLQQPVFDWTDPIAGLLWSLERQGHKLCGFELFAGMQVPEGAGLGGAAALQAATLLALADLLALSLTASEMGRFCHQAQYGFLGRAGSLAAPMAALLARAGHASVVDCGTGQHRAVPLQLGEHCLLAADAGFRRFVLSDEADEVATDCRRILEAVRLTRPEVGLLSEVTSEDVERLEAPLAERCRQLLAESERAGQAEAAIEDGNFPVLGQLLREAHEAVAARWQQRSPEVAGLARLALVTSGVLGARLSQEDRSGCLVALVETGAVEELRSRLERFYYQRYDLPPAIFPVQAAGEGTAAESVLAG